MNTLGLTLAALSMLIVLEMRARPDHYRTAEVTGVAWMMLCSVGYAINPEPALLIITAISATLWLISLTRRLRRRA